MVNDRDDVFEHRVSQQYRYCNRGPTWRPLLQSLFLLKLTIGEPVNYQIESGPPTLASNAPRSKHHMRDHPLVFGDSFCKGQPAYRKTFRVFPKGRIIESPQNESTESKRGKR
jgi:hypothetical protein